MVAAPTTLAPSSQPAEHAPLHSSSHYELRFTALFEAGRGYAFPCDADGNVDIDGLTERARANYFYVRTTVGRDFRAPTMYEVMDGGLE